VDRPSSRSGHTGSGDPARARRDDNEIERCLRYVDPIDDSAYFTALQLGREK